MHYTAVIEIHASGTKKAATSAQTSTSRYTTSEPERPARVTREVARIVLRADSIDKLIIKAQSHLELVEDIQEDSL